MCVSLPNSRGFYRLFVPLVANFASAKWDSPVYRGGCGNEKTKSEFTPQVSIVYVEAQVSGAILRAQGAEVHDTCSALQFLVSSERLKGLPGTESLQGNRFCPDFHYEANHKNQPSKQTKNKEESCHDDPPPASPQTAGKLNFI